MAYTYNEILERMNNKFTQLAGYEPDRASDIGIRIKLLAGELYSLSSNVEWLKKQMFPNTATGEQLDMHALQRGLERISGNKATGTLVFKLDIPLDYDIVIPQGTLCTTADGTLNYLTVEEKTIERGNLLVFVPAQAENSGEQYNIARDEVKVIVTYFAAGLGISNSTSFSGGTDDESDEELRERLSESLRNTPNGANIAYYVNIAKSVDGIQSASVNLLEGDLGVLTVYLGGRGDIPDNDACAEARDLLNQNRPFGIVINVLMPTLISTDVSVRIKEKQGYTFSEVQQNVEESVNNFFLDLGVGEDVTLAALGKAVFDTDGVENYSFLNMSDTNIGISQLAVIGNVTVNPLHS